MHDVNFNDAEIEAEVAMAWLQSGYAVRADNGLHEPWLSLVNGGFANYSDNKVYPNWKTGYWTPPEPINSRFEILDL